MIARPKKPEHFETPDFHNIPSHSKLINIQKLPKSLQEILFLNIFLETKDAELFTKMEFPELKLLALREIGEKESSPTPAPAGGKNFTLAASLVCIILFAHRIFASYLYFRLVFVFVPCASY